MIIERFRNLIQVVESRIELFDKLRDFDLLEKSDLAPVIECLTVSSILHLDAYVRCLVLFYMLFDAVIEGVFFLALTTSWTFWEDFTCLDISQCLLNKSILSVAAKYVDSGLSGCLVQFLVLGTKVGFHFSCLQFVDIHVWFCLVVCQFLTLLRLCVH